MCTAQSIEALESNFKYFKYIILIIIVYTNYIFVHLLDNKGVLIVELFLFESITN